MKNNLLRLHGSIQHYAWGGYEYIPDLLGISNDKKEPYAELWMGTHHRGPAQLEQNGEKLRLSEALERHPDWLGKIGQPFGELPFLFKVLDVREMLSIQAHPDKAQAIAGFKEENEAGISLDAPHRNFKDANHKPEIMVALSDFWLLHGFKTQEKLRETLKRVPEFSSLLPYLSKGGLYTLYKYVMELPQQQVNELLKPMKARLAGQVFAKEEPEYWAQKAFATHQLEGGHCDRGIFSIFFFNLLKVEPGQGIFQGAGVPHAYLEGKNVELMANSDNVFRGGLTPKHIDVPQLLKHLIFEPVVPEVLLPQLRSENGTWAYFKSPASDFELKMLRTEEKGALSFDREEAPQVLIFMEGEITTDDTGQLFRRGDIAFIPAGTAYRLIFSGPSLIFNATLPW